MMNAVRINNIYDLLMMLKTCLSQMQLRLATYEVYVQNGIFTSCTSCMREQCQNKAQNHLKWVHAPFRIGFVCIWSSKMVLWKFLLKTTWMSTWQCKWNSSHVMNVLETRGHEENFANRTTHFGALVEKLCSFEVPCILCHDLIISP